MKYLWQLGVPQAERSRIVQDMEREGQLEDIREQEEEDRVPTRVDIDKTPEIEDSVVNLGNS